MIHPSERPGDEDHDALIQAVVDAVGRGVKVELITSEWQANPLGPLLPVAR